MRGRGHLPSRRGAFNLAERSEAICLEGEGPSAIKEEGLDCLEGRYRKSLYR
jgi:hypothetical protein